VRRAASVSELEFADLRVKPQELKLAKQVLASFETGADIESFTDHYQKSLKAMLAKKKATGVESAEPEGDAPRKVVNLMDALRQSLEQAGRKPRAKKVPKAKAARVLPHARAKRKAS
jgi:DNA end-binding protein Ku